MISHQINENIQLIIQENHPITVLDQYYSHLKFYKVVNVLNMVHELFFQFRLTIIDEKILLIYIAVKVNPWFIDFN